MGHYRERVSTAVEWASLVLDVPQPEVTYEDTDNLVELGVWGLADRYRNMLTLNALLLQARPDMIMEVVTHEMAHIVSPLPGHGTEWKRIKNKLRSEV